MRKLPFSMLYGIFLVIVSVITMMLAFILDANEDFRAVLMLITAALVFNTVSDIVVVYVKRKREKSKEILRKLSELDGLNAKEYDR